MPQNIINGDFEGSPLVSPVNAPPFWAILSGSPVVKTDTPFAGRGYCFFPNSQNDSIKQTFPSPVTTAQFSTWVNVGQNSIFNYKFYFADGTSETDVSPPGPAPSFNINLINKVTSNGVSDSGIFNLTSLNNVLTNDFIFVGFNIVGNNSLISITDNQLNAYTIFSTNYNAANNNTLIMAGTYAGQPGSITVNGQWSSGFDSNFFGASIANYRGANGVIPSNIQTAGSNNNINITATNPSTLIGIGDAYTTGNNQNNRAIFDRNIPTFITSFEFAVSGTNYFIGPSNQTMTPNVQMGPFQTLMVWVNVLMQNSTDVPTVSVTDGNGAFYTYNTTFISGPIFGPPGANRVFLFVASIGNLQTNPIITIHVAGSTVQAWDSVIQLLGSVIATKNNIIQGTNVKIFAPVNTSTVNISLPGTMNYSSMIGGYFWAHAPNGVPFVVGNGIPAAFNTTIEAGYGTNSTFNFAHGTTHTTLLINDGVGTTGVVATNQDFVMFVGIEVDCTNSTGGLNPVASMQDRQVTAGGFNFTVPGSSHVSVLELDATLSSPWIKYQRNFSPAKNITAVEINTPSTNTNPVGFDEVQLWDDSIGVEISDLPKYQALIFRGLHPESEDNWMRGYINGGTGVINTDGDILTEYISGSALFVDYGNNLRQTIDVVNTYKTMLVRVKGTAPNYSIFLHTQGNNFTVVNNAVTPSAWQIIAYDLSQSTQNPIDSFFLRASQNNSPSDGSNYVKWDFVLFCTGSFLDVSQDIMNLQTKNSTQQIGDFSVEINNFNGKYSSGSNVFRYWDDIIIYGGYKTFTGSSEINYEKIFGGKIEEIIPRLSQTDGEVFSVTGQAYGNGLKNVLAFAEYSSTGSLISNQIVWPTVGNIMNDVVNRFTNATQVAYFSRGGSSTIIVDQPTGYRIPTDMTGSGRFNTANTIGGYASWQTGSLLYYYQVRQAPVWSALSDLGDLYFSTQTTGSGIMVGDTPIQSIDYYVSPARALHFEQISQARIRGRHFGKVINAVPGNSDIIDMDLQADVNDMQNKVNYFSSFWLPSTGDAWTEGDASSWVISTGTADNPTGWNTVDNIFAQVGSFSVEFTGSAVGNSQSTIFLGFNLPGSINFYGFGSVISVPFLFFYHWAYANATNNGYFLDIRAETNANTDYFSMRSNGMITGSGGANNIEFVWPGIYSIFGGWHYAGNVGLGVGAVPIGPYAPTGSGFNNWTKTGNPNWNNINRISVGFTADGAPGTIGSGSIDGLHIESLRYDIATNSASIRKFALREEFVTDPLIKDSGSSPLFAKAEILRFGKPIIRGTIKTAFYPTAHPAQLLTLNYPNGGFYNQDFRVVDVEHNISASEGATTTFTLNSDTGSTNPIHRSDIINAILNSSAVGNQSVIELLNVQFDPFLTPNIIDYPS